MQFEDDDYFYYVKAVPKMTKKYLGDPPKEKKFNSSEFRNSEKNGMKTGGSKKGGPRDYDIKGRSDRKY